MQFQNTTNTLGVKSFMKTKGLSGKPGVIDLIKWASFGNVLKNGNFSVELFFLEKIFFVGKPKIVLIYVYFYK